MKNNIKYYFVEDFDPGLDYQDGRVVSLTPRASHQLLSHGIPYQILEEFYNEAELRKEEQLFFRNELEWIGHFDEFLRKEISYCRMKNLSLAKMYFIHIKYFLDSIIIQTRILRSTLEKVSALGASILYVKKKDLPKKKTMQYFRTDRRSICFSDLLPLVLKKVPVNCSFHYIDKIAEDDSSSYKGLFRRVASKLLMRDVFRIVRLFIKYRISHLFKRKKKRKAANVLFSHIGGPHLDPVIKDFAKESSNIYACVENSIYSLSEFKLPSFLGRSVIPSVSELELINECRRASLKLADKDNQLLEWVNQECEGIDIRSFILPYFQSFIEVTCFELIKKSASFEKYYNKRNIQYLITHTSSDITSKSALIAAQNRSDLKTVCIQHGCQAFEDQTWHITDIDAFDYYVSTDSFSENEFKKCTQYDYVSNCKIFQSPHYLSQFRNNKNIQKNKNLKKIKTVLYIPTNNVSHVRHYNWMAYPPAWYFEFQKSLVDYFGSKKSFHIIYKHGTSDKCYAEHSILPYLSQKQYGNISVESKTTLDAIQGVDAVLLDRPTTAFFETVSSYLPVLAIYPNFVNSVILGDAKDYFGKSLQSFSSTKEALDIISKFLLSDGQEYVHDIKLKNNFFVNQLKEQ